jgi:hypothetical protein
MGSHGHAAALAAAMLAVVASGPPAHAAPAEPVAQPGAAPQAPASSPPAGASTFSVKTGTCEQFLALAPDVRGLVVAWTAGHYHTLDRWVMDASTARTVVAGVEQACGKARAASFRYKVVEEVSKLR